jgi:peptidoglycan/xylan/chitin deacetylase (PgdA/CDA1 family)
VWIEEFDALYASTGFFMLVCHPSLSGRPSRVRALARLIEHIQGSSGARFCTASEAADLWRVATHDDAGEDPGA